MSINAESELRTNNLQDSADAKTVWDYLKGQNLSDYAVAGLMGNLYTMPKTNQIPEDMIKAKVPINDTESFIITTDNKVYLQTSYNVYSSRDITNMGIFAYHTMTDSSAPSNMQTDPINKSPIIINTIEWPLRIDKSRDVFFSHNEIVALWYSSPNDGMIRLWRGEAWAIPDEYNDLFIMKFFGAVADNIWESDAINIIVNATDDTPKNLPPKYRDNSGCSDSMKEE